MWRALFAIAHADNIVTDEELAFMAAILEDVNFTDEQIIILKDDIINPKNIEEMFGLITKKEDKIEFFNFAHDMVWADGSFVSQEQEVMVRLLEGHVKETNVDDLVGSVSLQFEEEKAPQNLGNNTAPKAKGGLIEMIKSFRSHFS